MFIALLSSSLSLSNPTGPVGTVFFFPYFPAEGKRDKSRPMSSSNYSVKDTPEHPAKKKVW